MRSVARNNNNNNNNQSFVSTLLHNIAYTHNIYSIFLPLFVRSTRGSIGQRIYRERERESRDRDCVTDGWRDSVFQIRLAIKDGDEGGRGGIVGRARGQPDRSGE